MKLRNARAALHDHVYRHLAGPRYWNRTLRVASAAGAGLWWRQYRRYAASRTWRRLRRAVLASQPTCRCGRPTTQAHHLTYARAGRERFRDLEALCQSCHDRTHARR